MCIICMPADPEKFIRPLGSGLTKGFEILCEFCNLNQEQWVLKTAEPSLSSHNKFSNVVRCTTCICMLERGAEMQVACFSRQFSTLFIIYYYYYLLWLLLSLLRQIFPVNSKPTECVRCLSHNFQGGYFLLFTPTRLELDTHIYTWLLPKCSDIWTESIIVTSETLFCDNYIVPAIYYYKK